MINSKELHINPKEEQEFIYTKDYIVINSGLKLYFHKIDKILAGNPNKKELDAKLKQIEIADYDF